MRKEFYLQRRGGLYRVAGPLHNPQRDFARLPPLPPPRVTKTYATQAVRRPLEDITQLRGNNAESNIESSNNINNSSSSLPVPAVTAVVRHKPPTQLPLTADAFVLNIESSNQPAGFETLLDSDAGGGDQRKELSDEVAAKPPPDELADMPYHTQRWKRMRQIRRNGRRKCSCDPQSICYSPVTDELCHSFPAKRIK
ncbi:hypothetical protein H4R20_003026 [Coemansia guatemalensis]|uniref:Uncharacterized protein n=1 Tax=Coemansia guatemalensis TaxID=2761395 RepID=A0A9W8HWF4_9FUNG|nr:hypothetical protein H4R20_003026 [Coemansia guatemalensis]